MLKKINKTFGTIKKILLNKQWWYSNVFRFVKLYFLRQNFHLVFYTELKYYPWKFS